MHTPRKIPLEPISTVLVLLPVQKRQFFFCVENVIWLVPQKQLFSASLYIPVPVDDNTMRALKCLFDG
jgi:hypothetical protein